MQHEHVGLAWNFRVNPDSCSSPEHYENYLRLSAITEQRIGNGTTFLHVSDDKITGFITLRANSLLMQADGVVFGKPAIEIAELAVDKDYEGKGIGTFMVEYALIKAVALTQNHLGIKYAVLCADPMAVPFYSRERLGFSLMRDLYEIPRDGWNDNCSPMIFQLFED